MRYALLNVSEKTYHTVKYSVKTLASISDCIIFLYLGKVVFSSNVKLEFHPPGFILWTLALCLIVRFAVVFLLSAIINRAVALSL